MSVFLVCAVKDEAVGAFMSPFVMRSRNEALRSFQQACGDKDAPFVKNPADYTLYIVGEWDDDAGLMRELAKNEKIMSAKDCVG